MIYSPLIKQRITIKNSKLTGSEVADALAKMEDIKITHIGSDYIQAKKYNTDMFFHNSFAPVTDVTLAHTEKATELTLSSHMYKSIQIGTTVISAIVLLFQIAILICFHNDVSLPMLIPIFCIIFLKLLSTLGLFIEGCKIKKFLKQTLSANR